MEFGAIDVTGVEPNVACGAILWRYGGALRATIVAKASFDLVHDLPMTLRKPDELVVNDRHAGNNAARSVQVASDMVPYRPRADVTFVGHAHAPRSGPVSAAVVRFALYRDTMILERTLHVYGDRDASGEVQPFKRMAIVPERALASPENPVGVPRPNILDARGPASSAWLAPISRYWLSRKKLLRGGKAPDSSGIVDIANDLDWSYFQSALPEQQVSFLRGDEWVVLDGVHPSLPRLKTQLPAVRAGAMVHVVAPGSATVGAGHLLELVIDGLAVDGDKMTASLTFRGSFSLENEAAIAHLKVLVGLEVAGAAIRWPAPETIPLPRPVEIPVAKPKLNLNETRTLENDESAPPVDPIPFRPAAPPKEEEISGTFALTPEEAASLGARKP